MTEHSPRKEYSLRNIEKQSVVLNYVTSIDTTEVDHGQERKHLNMTQTSSTSVGQVKRNQQQPPRHPEKEPRTYHKMTSVSVISAPVKPDEPAPVVKQAIMRG